MSPHQHDRVLAAMSHLPHILSYGLARSTSVTLPNPPHSILDMTRIARSDPDLWDDIFFSNRVALLAAIDRFDRELHTLRRFLVQGRKASLRQRLTEAKAQSDALRRR
jgi:prephenate dehydrogenase